MPLSVAGLWLALIMMPASAANDLVRCATAGVGTGPTNNTSAPIEVKPAVRAFSSIYPDNLVSFPIRKTGFFLPFVNTRAAALPSFKAMFAVIGYVFAFPLTPSVPNNFMYLMNIAWFIYLIHNYFIIILRINR